MTQFVIFVLAAALALALWRVAVLNRENGALERRLMTQNREIEQARRMIDVGWIASGVAHDLNNGLFVITGTVQVLLLQKWPKKALEQFRRILAGAELCKHIVSNLLAQARDSELERAPTDVKAIIESILVILDQQFEERNIRVKREFAPQPFNAAVSLPHMQRLFLNLLSNSIKAMPSGGTLTVRTGLAPSKTNGYSQDLRISIEDTGPGVPPEILDKLFTAFTTQSDQGTGLGLFLFRKIALKHGGMIEADNLPQGGARFTLTLPNYD